MPHKDAFWAGRKPALAREPNPAYTEGMIRVTGTITIGEEEIHQEFIRASGSGGQSYSGSDQSNYWKLRHYLPGFVWPIGHCGQRIL
ncbi:MAG: hypothetical protein ABSB32_04415 [Thermodesulfobacteriota bacterium]|jgi:hypothetical protein